VAVLAAFRLQDGPELPTVVAVAGPAAVSAPLTDPTPATPAEAAPAASVREPDLPDPAPPAVDGGEIRPTRPFERRYRRRDRYWLDMPFTPANWAPPEGPVRIALQAGHWRAEEAPAELSGLRDNGTRANGKAEWEVNLEIARQAASMLEEMGYLVDILPAVVPPSYRAHLFISIHADGSADPRASGYRVASPRRDVTGRASAAAALLERSYGEATGLKRLPTVTRRMRNYYAFNYGRYQHALHPQTIGVILETGFLTSAADRTVIVDDPGRAARGIVAAVTVFPETPPPVLATPVASGAGESGVATGAQE
jgi:N-acetylmuramoyl-L-alanine amidase